MLNREALEKYCQVILHEGCVLGERHIWNECSIQEFFRRVARKHQHKLKSNGLAIGIWIDETKYKIVEI